MVQAFTVSAAPAWPGYRDGVEQRDQFLGVGGLPGCEPGDQAAAASLGEQMQFGGRAAAGPADALGCPRLGRGQPPLRAPAACWCTRMMLASA
jgi:hypothetical protein